MKMPFACILAVAFTLGAGHKTTALLRKDKGVNKATSEQTVPLHSSPGASATASPRSSATLQVDGSGTISASKTGATAAIIVWGTGKYRTVTLGAGQQTTALVRKEESFNKATSEKTVSLHSSAGASATASPCSSATLQVGGSATIPASTTGATSPVDLIAIIGWGTGQYNSACYYAKTCRYVYAGGTTSSSTSNPAGVQTTVNVNVADLVDGIYECAFFHTGAWSTQVNSAENTDGAFVVKDGKAFPIKKMKDAWSRMKTEFGGPNPQPIALSETTPFDGELDGTIMKAKTSTSTFTPSSPTGLVAFCPFGTGLYDAACYNSAKCRYTYSGGTTASATSNPAGVQAEVDVNIAALVDGLYEECLFDASSYSTQKNTARALVNALLVLDGKGFPVLKMKEVWEGQVLQYNKTIHEASESR